MMSCFAFSFFVYIYVPGSTSFLCVIVHPPVDKRVRWCSLLSKFQLRTASVSLTVWSSNPQKFDLHVWLDFVSHAPTTLDVAACSDVNFIQNIYYAARWARKKRRLDIVSWSFPRKAILVVIFFCYNIKALSRLLTNSDQHFLVEWQVAILKAESGHHYENCTWKLLAGRCRELFDVVWQRNVWDSLLFCWISRSKCQWTKQRWHKGHPPCTLVLGNTSWLM